MKTSKRTISIVLLSCTLLFAMIVYVFVYRTSIIIPTQETNQEIDEIVRTIYENGQFSGAVLVAVNGNIIYNDAFGYANIEDRILNTSDTAFGYANIEDRILNTSDTKFRIASFTKPFTAMLILQLV
ncbi:MAG: serine hydrolase [Deltaproteobacteria bacterium]|nr:serine hydrolase [Deltaproteobacteria bacterium]